MALGYLALKSLFNLKVRIRSLLGGVIFPTSSQDHCFVFNLRYSHFLNFI